MLDFKSSKRYLLKSCNEYQDVLIPVSYCMCSDVSRTIKGRPYFWGEVALGGVRLTSRLAIKPNLAIRSTTPGKVGDPDTIQENPYKYRGAIIFY